MSAVEWHVFLFNDIFWNSLYRISMRRRSLNDRPHTPSGKKSVPAKVQFRTLINTLSYSSVVEFSTIGRVISIEAQNCFCEEQALFSLQ